MKYLIGNHKMNLSKTELIKYFKDLKKVAKQSNNFVGVCLPSVYLDLAQKMCKHTKNKKNSAICTKNNRKSAKSTRFCRFFCAFCLLTSRRRCGIMDRPYTSATGGISQLVMFHKFFVWFLCNLTIDSLSRKCYTNNRKRGNEYVK